MKSRREGWAGWDAYAPFYDWENARTLGRRDVGFWERFVRRVGGRVLELGCGTGRVSWPLAKSGIPIVGIDRSEAMLERLRSRTARLRRGKTRQRLQAVRGDIRMLPFARGSFSVVLAPYGVLQSLLADRDMTATLASVGEMLAPGGRFGVDLVPDVPEWREYRNRVQMKGRLGRHGHLTLVESVRQRPRQHLTIFEQCYIERRGAQTTEHSFELRFRTLPMKQMLRRLDRAGFTVDAVLGDYRGRAWDDRADVWLILATKRQ